MRASQEDARRFDQSPRLVMTFITEYGMQLAGTGFILLGTVMLWLGS